ncbi:MAG: hypothetical protein GZ085_01065 [Sulfuriferula multivorans]|uniref:Uncharacterized protein n=1 Tax=Sulfuriferula multivorans TaxID=1559896 RepID=A0A7C9NPZ7_9PROT|nr:hypothetical protein [Sulfuriferula multivorans]
MITTVHNKANMISDLVDSLLQQTGKPNEMLKGMPHLDLNANQAARLIRVVPKCITGTQSTA